MLSDFVAIFMIVGLTIFLLLCINRRLLQTFEMIVLKKKRMVVAERDRRHRKNAEAQSSGIWGMIKVSRSYGKWIFVDVEGTCQVEAQVQSFNAP